MHSTHAYSLRVGIPVGEALIWRSMPVYTIKNEKNHNNWFPDSMLCGNDELKDNNQVAVALVLIPLVWNKSETRVLIR